jgi:hypothetical protein
MNSLGLLLMKISSSQDHTLFSQILPQLAGTRQESPRFSSQGIEEQAAIAKLRKRDQEVRTHEQAHIAAAGGLAKGGATLSFQRGTDGKQYAVGGEVNIDTSPVSGNPKATIQKAKQIRAAALAPADPSAQDRAVAASASAMEARARQEIQKEEQKASASSDEDAPKTSTRIDLFA